METQAVTTQLCFFSCCSLGFSMSDWGWDQKGWSLHTPVVDRHWSSNHLDLEGNYRELDNQVFHVLLENLQQLSKCCCAGAWVSVVQDTLVDSRDQPFWPLAFYTYSQTYGKQGRTILKGMGTAGYSKEGKRYCRGMEWDRTEHFSWKGPTIIICPTGWLVWGWSEAKTCY